MLETLAKLLISDNVTHSTFMDADDAYIVGGLDSLLDHLF